jgi:ssDNA-binding Zn-finger/Zn-ribbon topoisomerase 1
MVLRKGFYGEFLGCNNYPTCKTMMRITNGVVDKNPVDMSKNKKKSQKKKTSSKKKEEKK